MTRIEHIVRIATARFAWLRTTPAFETAGGVETEKRVSRQDIEALLQSELGTLPPLAG